MIARLIDRIPQKERPVLVNRALRTTIYLWHGSRIIALPANPATLRGYSANVILIDEGDYFRDSEDIFHGTLYPMLTTTDGWLIVSSTPWTTKGFYYQICQEGSGYNHHFINYHDAVKAGIAKENVIKEAEKNMPPEIFRREYLCEFVEDVDSFLPSDLIARCIDSNLELTQFEQTLNGDLMIGVDFGKHQDFSVVIMVERRGEEVLLKHLHRFPLETPYASVIGYVKTLCDRCSSVSSVKPDQTGVGDYIVEDMIRAGIPNVEGVNFTRQSKESMAVPVKQAMINRRIHIPYDRDLIAELNVEKYEMTKDGHYQFSHPDRTHDDRFWAFILACSAALGDTSTPYTGRVF